MSVSWEVAEQFKGNWLREYFLSCLLPIKSRKQMPCLASDFPTINSNNQFNTTSWGTGLQSCLYPAGTELFPLPVGNFNTKLPASLLLEIHCSLHSPQKWRSILLHQGSILDTDSRRQPGRRTISIPEQTPLIGLIGSSWLSSDSWISYYWLGIGTARIPHLSLISHLTCWDLAMLASTEFSREHSFPTTERSA